MDISLKIWVHHPPSATTLTRHQLCKFHLLQTPIILLRKGLLITRKFRELKGIAQILATGKYSWAHFPHIHFGLTLKTNNQAKLNE
ncbi:Axial regulator YABBY 5, partial [Bienertia sinuspersici]